MKIVLQTFCIITIFTLSRVSDNSNEQNICLRILQVVLVTTLEKQVLHASTKKRDSKKE